MSNNIRVGIDDGHGIDTPGKRTPDGYQENEFNHWTKTRLIQELNRCGFVCVDCSPTRDDNSLQDRCNIANHYQCDIFVSIHYNAIGSSWREDVGGIETYYWSGSEDGKPLAQSIHAELIKNTPLRNRGVKSADFYVLRNTNMIAVLCECGFMDNPVEATLMKSEYYRNECAAEICQGICNYFKVPYVPEVPPEQPSQPEQPAQTNDRDIAIAKIKVVSKWWDKYIPYLDDMQKHVNIYGLIAKL